ncbi:hypothetical protein HQ38_09460 [Porphyromonas crevioricanis]|uniref:Uncharacterized protein n=1 Tax=Porphyromonas crevioricanis TaxID=393921 RepID=A0AB34PG14_9PORP|nr:hypothetical protein HQ38_09460 [Porphyromonas crevioricanis]
MLAKGDSSQPQKRERKQGQNIPDSSIKSTLGEKHKNTYTNIIIQIRHSYRTQISSKKSNKK